MSGFCSHCGAKIGEDATFCDFCGHRIENVSPGKSPDPAAPRQSRADSVTWFSNVPLLTDRFMLYDLLKVVVLSPAIFGLLLLVMLLIVGDMGYGELFRFIGFVFMIGAGALIALLVIVVLAVYWNHFPCKFTVNPEGSLFEVTARQRYLNRILAVIGALTGRPNLAGAGLLAQSRESLMMPWGDVQSIKYYPGPRVISLKNSWRTVLRLHCTPENFEEVALLCREGFASSAAHRAKRVAQAKRGRAVFMKSILNGLPWAGLSIVGSLLIGFSPLLEEPRYVYALLGISAAASFAAGGIRRFLGLGSLVILAALTLLMLARGNEVHTDIFGLMRTSGLDVATAGGDRIFLVLAILGMILVTVASLRNALAAGQPGQSGREIAQKSALIGIGIVFIVIAGAAIAHWRTKSVPAKPQIQTVEIRAYDPVLLRDFKQKYNAMIERLRLYEGSSGDSTNSARMDFEKARHAYELALQRILAQGSEIEKKSAGLIDQAFQSWMRFRSQAESQP